MLKNCKSATDSVEKLTAKLAELKGQFGSLKQEVAESKRSNRPLPSDITCHFCGMKGHVAHKCKVNPESDSYDPAMAKKWNKKKEQKDDKVGGRRVSSSEGQQGARGDRLRRRAGGWLPRAPAPRGNP